MPRGRWSAALSAAVVTISLLVGALAGSARAQSASAPLPQGWPNTLQLGISDGPGGAAGMRATAPYGFRYQYLAGGANTGGGWATWNPNGSFVTNYIQESIPHSVTPVFTYYMVSQSSPGGGSENNSVATNLQNRSTMTAYFADLKLFFQRAGAFPNTRVILHVEPDMWGFIQQRTTGDNASTFSVQVSSTGLPELGGLPNNAAGLGQAIVRLRDTYAANVVLGYHLSIWGTGVDIQYSKPPDAQVDALATRAGNFYRSLGASFDVIFGEFSDRDAAFKQFQYGDGGASWFSADDFRRHARFMNTVSGVTHKRLVLWQIPQGNTRMRAVNNTWNHYQDNRVEWLLDDPSRANLQTYVNSGVIAFLFGRGADGPTCACDANRDGVTNPAPINGNIGISLNADDDGGFFRQKAKDYYTLGPLALGSASPPPAPSPTPTAIRTQLSTATATNTRTSVAPTFSSSALASPSTVAPGATLVVSASVMSTTTTTTLVDIEIYDPTGAKVAQQFWDNQPFSAGQQRTYTLNWTAPANSATGTFVVRVGIFRPGWGTLYHWNGSAATFSVAAAGTATPTRTSTLVPTATRTATPEPTATPAQPIQPSFTSSGSASPSSAARGGSVTLTAALTANAASTAIVDLEIYDGSGRKVAQQWWGNQMFVAGQPRTFAFTWAVPSAAAPGNYTLKVGVFKSPDWGALYHWNNAAGGFTVQ